MNLLKKYLPYLIASLALLVIPFAISFVLVYLVMLAYQEIPSIRPFLDFFRFCFLASLCEPVTSKDALGDKLDAYFHIAYLVSIIPGYFIARIIAKMYVKEYLYVTGGSIIIVLFSLLKLIT